MKILAHFTDWNQNEERKERNLPGGGGYYRTVKPCEQITGHEIDVWGREITEQGNDVQTWDNIFKKYDVLWIRYFQSPESAAAIMFFRDRYKKKVIIDLDDDYLAVPESNPIYKDYAPGSAAKGFLGATISLADAITVSTEPLKDKFATHLLRTHGIEKPILVIPNMNDVKDWDFKPAKKHKDKIVVGYTGSNSHDDDIKFILPKMANVMKKHPNVYFELLGTVRKEVVKDIFKDFPEELMDRVALLGATNTFADYPEHLARQKWDIGIAPLLDTEFNRSKSHIKWMEYSMFEIPTVASRTYPYFYDIGGRKTIEDGVTGFLCRSNEWEEKLEKLILDKELRKTIGKQAKKHIEKEWQYKDSEIGKEFDEFLRSL